MPKTQPSPEKYRGEFEPVASLWRAAEDALDAFKKAGVPADRDLQQKMTALEATLAKIEQWRARAEDLKHLIEQAPSLGSDGDVDLIGDWTYHNEAKQAAERGHWIDAWVFVPDDDED